MADKSFKVKDGLTVPSLSTAGIVKTDSSGSISSSAVLGISEGGTGQTSAGNALNALLPLQTSNENKYLQTNGVTVQWNAIGSTYSIGNTASRPLSPVIGQIYSNTQTGYIEVYTAAGWSQLGVIPLTPSTPTATDVGTNVAYGSGSVDISFTPATGGGLASTFTATSTPSSITGSASTSPVRVTGLTTGTSYTFTIIATNGYGNAVATSPSNSVTTTSVPQAPTIGSPSVPTGQAFASNANATIAFTANANGGKAISSYTATSSPGGITGTGSSSPITVSGLTRETAYTFTVTATNANGTSLSSAASAAATPTTVPATMSAPTATNSGSGRAFNNGLASVAFTAPSTGGQTITGYTVTSSPGGYTGTGSSSPINVAGLQSNTNYTFTATATNSNGTSIASQASNQILATTVPQAPTIGTVSRTNNTTVSVPFTAGANGGSAITSYVVTSSPSISLTTSGTTSPLTVTGAFANTQAYTFTVSAVNANGTSSASSSSNSITPKNAVSSVEYLVVAGGGGGGQYGGGGGAGGFRTNVAGSTSGGGASAEGAFSVTEGTSYTVTVGGGGTVGTNATQGSNSSFGSIISLGGGGGGGQSNGPDNGGSGGGGTGDGSGVPGNGTSGQGYNGGSAWSGPNYVSGGGGGAGGVGGSAPNSTTSGNGGSGQLSSITGSSQGYAGGGPGGGGWSSLGYSNGNSPSNAGTGYGNGGIGGFWTGSSVAGGGGGQAGVVIVRYSNSFPAPVSVTGATDISTGAFRIYRWTSNGSITFV